MAHSRRHRCYAQILLVLCFSQCFSTLGFAQVLITPRRSGQSQVRTFPQQWQRALLQPSCQGIEQSCAQAALVQRRSEQGGDLPVSPPALPSAEQVEAQANQHITSGIMLYFETASQEVAERAAAQIEDTYKELVQWFQFVPRIVFPYVLYSSYQAFLQTTLSAVQEGVLGITSTIDLSVVLPYFGDDALFRHVSKHELVHQFTLQYVRHRAALYQLERDPVEWLPLWFVEGLAEYIAHDGIDAESRALVRDLLVYPQEGWPLPTFYGLGVPAYSSIYKFGQIRCAFLAEKYGAHALLELLDYMSSPLMGQNPNQPDSFLDWTTPAMHFQEAVEHVIHVKPPQLERQFAKWLRQWAYKDYLGGQENPEWPELALDEMFWLDAMVAAPDGKTLLVRAREPQSGQLALYLLDPNRPSQPQLVVSDGQPGVESLHALQQHSMALGEQWLMYTAEAVGQDRLYVHRYHKVDDGGGTTRWLVEPAHIVDVGAAGIVGIVALASAPEQQGVAVIGLSRQGERNIYWLDWQSGTNAVITAITQDKASKRAVAVAAGQIWFTSDLGTPGIFHLFQYSLGQSGQTGQTAQPARWLGTPGLPIEAIYASPAGNLYLVAVSEDGSANLYQWQDDHMERLTNLATAVKQLAAGPDDHLWCLLFRQGRYWLAQIPLSQHPPQTPSPSLPAAEPQVAALAPASGESALGEQAAVMEEQPAPQPAPTEQLEDSVEPSLHQPRLQHATPYTLLRWDTWRGGALQGFLGGSAAGLFGQLYASVHDLLGQHRFVLNMYALGSLQLTDMQLLYINQTSRWTFVTGPFQRLQFRYDRGILRNANMYAFERFYGGLLSARYPLHRFHYLQVDYQAGAVEYVLDEMTKRWLQDGGKNGLGMDMLPQWQRQNKGIWLQHGLTLLWGQDTIRYHPRTGPIAGYGWLLELTGMQQPQRRWVDQLYGIVRLDTCWYFPLLDSANLLVRAAGGTSFGGAFARQFFLSSFDTLRGVPFGDTRFLLGRHYLYGTLEAQLPLTMLIHVAFLSNVEAIAAVDVGGVGGSLAGIVERRVLAGVLGMNIGFGPLVLRIHMAKPIAIGAQLPVAASKWVPNINLGFLYE